MVMNPAPLQSSTIPELKVDGQAQPDLSRDLTLLQIEEDVSGMRRMLASFIAVGPRDGERDEQLNWLDGRVLDFGKAVVVSMGPTDAREEVFNGKVSAFELAMDRALAGNRTARRDRGAIAVDRRLRRRGNARVAIEPDVIV